jgi:hypothetical protein
MKDENVFVNNEFYSYNSPNGSYERYSLSDVEQNITYNQIYRQ